WERNRSLNTQFNFRPRVTDWLQPGFTYAARFGTDRNPSYLEILEDEHGETTAIMQADFSADRTVTRSLSLDPTRLVRAAVHATVAPETRFMRALAETSRVLQTITVNWTDGVNSRFQRETAHPGLRYQFGLG